MKSKAVYPGSFDPFTWGHRDITEKGLKEFGHIVVLVCETPDKYYMFNPDERVAMVRESFHLQNLFLENFADRVSVDKLGNKLLVDFVRSAGSRYIIRGWRDNLDLEYENRRVLANKKLDPGIETILYEASEEYRFLSSSLIREIVKCEGGLEKIREHIHPFVYERLKSKIQDITFK